MEMDCVKVVKIHSFSHLFVMYLLRLYSSNFAKYWDITTNKTAEVFYPYKAYNPKRGINIFLSYMF